jgi:hypothetical protein
MLKIPEAKILIMREGVYNNISLFILSVDCHSFNPDGGCRG